MLDEIGADSKTKADSRISFFLKVSFLEIRKMKIESTTSAKAAKVNILQCKSIALDEQIEKIVEHSEKVRNVSPPRYHTDLKTDDLKNAIKQTMNLLKSFCSDNDNISKTFAPTKIWDQLKKALHAVPNAFVFQAVLKDLERNEKDLSQLDSSSCDDGTANSSSHLLIPKMKYQLIAASVEALSQKRKLADITSECTPLIEKATNDIEEMLNNSIDYSIGDEDDIGDFVAAMLAQLILSGKFKHLNEIVSQLKPQIKEEEEVSKNYSAALLNVRNSYSLIDEKIFAAQQFTTQVFHINQKLNIGKIAMIQLVQSVKSSSTNKNTSLMPVMPTPQTVSAIPNHFSELEAFLGTFVGKFDNTSSAVAFHTRSNHMLHGDDHVAQLMRNTKGNITNLTCLLASMEGNIQVHQDLVNVTWKKNEIESPSDFSCNKLEKQLSEYREAVTELLDEIAKTNVASKSVLRDLKVLSKFSHNNSFKNFIPATKKFNGKSYKTYENEFNMYYKMTKD